MLKSVMHYFSVSKGNDDIHMVYDGTKSGLNAATWVPWFVIPPNATLERLVVPGTKQADNDLEDMFHNFLLHEAMRELTGADMSALFPELIKGGDSGVYVAWERYTMGLMGSPYGCYQGVIRAKRVVLASRKDGGNPFHWDTVVLNFLGDMGYDPTQPRIFKITKAGWMAADLVIYIDDCRETANSLKEAWLASSWVAKTLAWLGLQDAARKRRAPSQGPGPAQSFGRPSQV
jgi:hypothetical protein